MKIGGFQRFSVIDYPGKLCAIVFTQGCNFRCPYCHNPELVYPELFSKPIPEEDLFAFLKTRQGKLDAVVITGGEPTQQPDLIDFISKIKADDYLVKLDTNGSKPEVIRELIELRMVDYFAMDVKAPLARYAEIVSSSSNADPARIRASIELIKHSGIDYEFRTTVVKAQLDKADILEIGKLIQGSKRYILQKFVPAKAKVLSPKVLTESYTDDNLECLRNAVQNYVDECRVR
ncbi:MAG: anaerobic ribonucleoside-triphosphate reductase activating protein [Halobacteriota archaeon]